jgi:hypothetical protein
LGKSKGRKMNDKELEIQYRTPSRIGRSFNFITAMLSRFDPNIHDKIKITIVSTSEVEALQQENAKLKERLKDVDVVMSFYSKSWEIGEFEDDLVVRIAGSYDHFVGVHELARKYLEKWGSDE